MGFRLVPIKMTLNDLERQQHPILHYIAFCEARCVKVKIDPYYIDPYYRR